MLLQLSVPTVHFTLQGLDAAAKHVDVAFLAPHSWVGREGFFLGQLHIKSHTIMQFMPALCCINILRAGVGVVKLVRRCEERYGSLDLSE